ncbi:MAG: alpha/beta hydrolase [Saprospiraceae bacterium]|nr:alpha/beta hydrolase [Saprospiraceae bacterium]
MKTDVILLHGALGSEKQFTELRELLSDFYNVYTFNFSGHGGRTIDQPFSIDLFGEDTLAFMKDKNLVHPAVFGYSMGGYVALKLASEHLNIFQKIVTLATKFEWTKESAAKEVKMLQSDIIEEKIPRFAQMLHDRHVPEDWKMNMSYTADMMRALGNGDAMNEDDFEKIKTPVTICVGLEDNMVTQQESQWAADHIPSAKFILIAGLKHPIESILPERMKDILLKSFK